MSRAESRRTEEREGRGTWRDACFTDADAQHMRRINWWTEEDMQSTASTDNQKSPMEYIAGLIEVCCRADGFSAKTRSPDLDREET
jgi:hypothetical protein